MSRKRPRRHSHGTTPVPSMNANGAAPAAEPAHAPLEAEAPAPASSPLDPLGVGKTFFEVWGKMLEDPSALLEAQTTFANAQIALAQETMNKFFGQPAAPVATPIAGDKRWTNDAWTTNIAFDFMKQSYLLATDAILKSTEQTPGVDPKTRKRAQFFARQFANTMSPTNFAFFNPEVIEETIKTGGQNLVRGLQNLREDAEHNNGQPALVDKKAFTVGGNVATSPGKVVFRNELVEMIQYTPATPQAFAKPLVIVPPWINKYYILDLRPDNSFIKYAVDQGLTTFVLSWRNPGPELSSTTMDDYVQHGPLECSRAAADICGTDDVNIIGYCIGGTLTAMTLGYTQATDQKLINSATFFAALVDFAEPGEIDAFLSEDGLALVESKMAERGYLDASEMGSTFNMLRSNDLIWAAAINRYMLGKDPPAFDLLFWNGDSTRMPGAMHSYYLREMYIKNNLVKPGGMSVKGVPLDLHHVKSDVYCVATAEDHIAPWRSVYKMTQLFSGTTIFRLGFSGHIAGIVSPPGKKKGHYWKADANPANPEEWLQNSERIEGSWWPEWTAWIGARSGEKVDARQPGSNDKYPALDDAPGKYVFET